MKFGRSPYRAAHSCRLLAFVFLCVLLLSAPAAVHAESAEYTTAATVASVSPALGMNGTPLDTFSDPSLSGWMEDTGIRRLSLVKEGEHPYLLAETAPRTDNGEYAIMRLFGGEERINLMNYSHVSTTVKIGGSPDVTYTVSLTLYSALSTVTAQAQIPGDSWYAISADISSWHLRTGVDLFELRVYAPNGAGVGNIAVGALAGTGKASLEIADAFLTFGFTPDGGTAVYEDGAYLLDAGQDGIMTIVADAAREQYDAADGTLALKIVLANAVEGGTVSLAVSDAFSGLSSFDISSSCRLYHGTNTYLLPFDESLALHAYRLSFRGLYSSGTANDSVRLLSVSLVHLPETDTAVYRGKLSSCAFSEGLTSLTVAGTLPAGTVADHISGTLALYEIPVWSDLETVLTESEPIATMKISTRFTFSIDLKGHEAGATVSRYAVILQAEEQMIPVTPVRFPDLPKGEARAIRSSVGLAGADTAGVFSSNAANVIVDVYVDTLLGGTEGNTSGRLVIRGGRYYYLDTEYLRALDEELRFYEAADVDVYLRLLSGTDLSARSFTFSHDGAGFFAFDVTNEDGAYMLSAVTDYLAKSYPSLRGFIVGERLDNALYNGADMSDTDAYAALCADTLRVVYTAAAVHIPDVSIIAPIGHYLSEAQAYTADSADAADTVLLAVHLSRHITANGTMPLGFLYMSDSSAEMIGHLENLLGRMSAVGASAPQELFLLWHPAPTSAADILLLEYSDRCAAIASLNMRAFFLGVDRQADKDALYQLLKYVEVASDSDRHLYEFEADTLSREPDPRSYKGIYSLYDFTKSFSTMHWIAGSDCGTLTTQAGMIEAGQRSMHAAFLADDGSQFGETDGNILCMMPAALDFTKAARIVCTLLITSTLESTDTAEIVFVFGSDDARAEYALTVPVGTPITVLCDLSDYSGAANVSSAAILVRAASPVTLDVSRIQCMSDTLTTDELTAHLSTSIVGGTADGNAPFTLSLPQAVIVLTLAVSTFSVFALLSRRENSRKKNKESS